MAGGNGKRGGGERVLESRHLVGLFLGVVLLCSVFFTLGYVMGRTQYGTPMPLHASAAGRDIVTGMPSELSKPADAVPAPPNSEWDFDKQRDSNQLQPSSPASDTSSIRNCARGADDGFDECAEISAQFGHDAVWAAHREDGFR